MLAILLGLFRLIWLFGNGHDAVALENLALRQQLPIYERTNKRSAGNRTGDWFLSCGVCASEPSINSISPNFANSWRQSVPIDSQRK